MRNIFKIISGKVDYLTSTLSAPSIPIIDSKITGAHGDNSIPEAIQQLAHADRIILNKIDLFPSQESLLPVITDIRHINPQAVLITSTQSCVPIEDILNIQSFDVRKYEKDEISKNLSNPTAPQGSDEENERRQINITRGVFHIETNSEGKIILPKKKKRSLQQSQLSQKFLEENGEEIVRAEKIDVALSSSDHQRAAEDGRVSTISLTTNKPLNLNQFNRWISAFLKEKGNDIYRFKGSLSLLRPTLSSTGRYLGDERIRPKVCCPRNSHALQW